MAPIIWHGTPKEGEELMRILNAACTCDRAADGSRSMTCAGHKAFVEDQHFSDTLLFYRQFRDRLWQEEMEA